MTDYIDEYNSSCGGFNFDNCKRNEEIFKSLNARKLSHMNSLNENNTANQAQLMQQAYEEQRCRHLEKEIEHLVQSGDNSQIGGFKFTKTGTTICGVQCVDGLVLGADTRATSGKIVADPNCIKLHRLADNIFAAGAGTAADLEHTTDWLKEKIELVRLNTNSVPRVSMAISTLSQELFNYQGYKGCAVVIGGYDVTGPALYTVAPHGSSDQLPYCAMGSGSLNALTVLETYYNDKLTVSEGKKLVCKAISAGITNDLGSGSNVDILVLRKETDATTSNASAKRDDESSTVSVKHANKKKINLYEMLDSEDDGEGITDEKHYSANLYDSDSYPAVNTLQAKPEKKHKNLHSPYQRHFTLMPDKNFLIATHYRKYLRPIQETHTRSTTKCRFNPNTTAILKENVTKLFRNNVTIENM